MSAWKAGKICWFSEEYEEGMVIDSKDGDFYYLNISAAKKLKKSKKSKSAKKIKFKVNNIIRSNQISDIEFD